MTLSVPLGAAVDHPDRLLMCLDATATDVFATLCRLTVGDLANSDRLLGETYARAGQRLASNPDVALDRDALVAMAVSTYLFDVEHADGTISMRLVPDAGDHGWSQTRSAPMLHALHALEPRERVILALLEVEGYTSTAVAELLGSTPAEVDACRAIANAHLAESLITESPGEAFSHAELWLDDALRDRVRAGLRSVPDRRGARSSSERMRASRSPVTLARVTAVAVGLVAGALATLGMRWLEMAPGSERGVGAPIAAAPLATATSRNLTNPGDVVEAIPVLDLQLAGHLNDQAVVQLDLIVRYPTSQAVGISWTGPCNRPAARLTFTQAPNGIGVQLRTGAFPVVSCVGMPRRWTLVVEEYLGAGTILPLVDGHLDRSFRGASVDRATEAQTLAGPLYGSVLVDAANRPWVYPGRNCGTFGFLRRQSPDGAMFEVRTGLAPGALVPPDQTVGNISCLTSAIPEVLYGPDGSVFPQLDLSSGGLNPPDPVAPRDCRGPFGSATEVPSERPFTTQFYDGDWTTWDGCLVRSDVIFSRNLAASCGLGSVRTITMADTIGDRIGPVQRTRTYLRDPDRRLLRSEAIPGIDSGLRFGTDELRYSPTSPDEIYIVTATVIERWSLLSAVPRCNA